MLRNLYIDSFSLHLHLSSVIKRGYLDDVLESEKALYEIIPCFYNRQILQNGNNGQQCSRSAVYPYVSQHKAYISIERGLFLVLCVVGVWRYQEAGG